MAEKTKRSFHAQGSGFTAEKIAALRQRLAAMAVGSPRPVHPHAMPFDTPAIDQVLPWGGLPRGALHEVHGAAIRDDESPGNDVAAAGFCIALLARFAALGPVVWISTRRDLYAPGLAGLGLDPARLLVVEASKGRAALWALEECLRTPGLSAALVEAVRIDFIQSRRLHLAAEASGVTAFLLYRAAPTRDGRQMAASAARTRWRVSPLPSTPLSSAPCTNAPPSGARIKNDMRSGAGVGPPRWRVELVHCRGGRAATWDVEWRPHAWRIMTDGRPAEAPGALAAAPSNGRASRYMNTKRRA